jgi:hypothetical protein
MREKQRVASFFISFVARPIMSQSLVRTVLLLVAFAAVVVALGSNSPRRAATSMRIADHRPAAPPLPPASQPNQYENELYYKNVPVHPFNATDLVRADRIGAPVASPNGLYAVYTRRVWSVSLNQSSTTLWLSYLQDGKAQPLTPFGWKGMQPLASMAMAWLDAHIPTITLYGLVSESDACWTSDSSTVLFLSNRDGGSTQVWQVTVPSSSSASPSAPIRITYVLSTTTTTTTAASLLLLIRQC